MIDAEEILADANWFHSQLNTTEIALVVPAGSSSGSICTVSIPKLIIENPDISGEEECTISVEGAGIASSALNDEVTIVFS